MSRVIRGAAPPARVVPGEVVDARGEAERIAGDARAEAERIVLLARAEADAIRERAHVEGLTQARIEIAAALLAATQLRDGAITGAEREVKTLALVAAGRIVGEAIALEPERMTAIVREALTRARRARGLEVRVHPDDAESLAASEGVTIVRDPSIARGGCVVRSELGVIDARVDVQLAAMAKLLGCDAP